MKEGFIVLDPDPIWGTDADTALHIGLVYPEIPGNTGNIGRLCAGTNIWLHLVEPFAFDLDNKKLRRAGLDYWPHVKLAVHPTLDDLVNRFRPEQIRCYSKKVPQRYTDAQYRSGDLLLFGCETKGLPMDVLDQYATQSYAIPTTDKVRSLNLSNAAAIVIYEAMRQLDFSQLN